MTGAGGPPGPPPFRAPAPAYIRGMCGRMVIAHSADEMARLFRARPANDLPELPNFNVCPTQPVPVVLPAGQGGEPRRLVAKRWGFIPAWAKSPSGGPLMINARAETVAEKPAFREAARARRCIVPATGFYEWTVGEGGERLPWYVARADGEVMALAAIWQDWRPKGGAEDGGGEPLSTCAVVTCAAAGEMRRLHHRTPVILAPESWSLWLGEAEGKAAPLMRPAPDGALRMHRVGREVNGNRAFGPGLIEPVEAPGGAPSGLPQPTLAETATTAPGGS